MNKDSKGQGYQEVGNIRVTKIDKTWDGNPGLRFNAKKGEGNKLHRGAEIPVPNLSTAIKLIYAIISAVLRKNK